MKKAIIFCLILLISISTLFRGLIFDFEIYCFLAISALLIICYLIYKLKKDEDIHFNKWYVFLGIVLIVAYLLSFTRAVNPRENVEALLQYTSYLLIFILIFDYFKANKQLLLSALIYPTVFAGFLCAIGGMEGLTGIEIMGATITGNRLSASFQYANTAAINFAICVVFIVALINVSKSVFTGALFIGIGNTLVFAIFFTGSRGGFLIGAAIIVLMLSIQPHGFKLKALVGIASMIIPVFFFSRELSDAAAIKSNLLISKWLFLSFITSFFIYILIISIKNVMVKKALLLSKALKKVSVAILITLAGVFTLIVVYAVLNRKIFISYLPNIFGERLENLSFTDYTLQLRLRFYRDAIEIISNNWLLGIGRGGWKALYHGVQDSLYNVTYSHNNYLEMFIETGIVGGIVNIALSVLALYQTIVAYIKSKDAKTRVYISGLFCGLFALLAHSAMDINLSFISLQLLLWTMYAASAPYKQKSLIILSSGAQIVLFVSLASLILSLNALYFTAAYNEQRALNYMDKKNYRNAVVYYEEASRLDPHNSVYLSERAMLYNYFAEKEDILDNKMVWMEKARAAAEMAVKEFKYYPYYKDILIRAYIASDMPLQALENAEALASFQKYRLENYELLAQCYIDASEYYICQGNLAKAKELLTKCLEIEKNYYYKNSKPEEIYSPEMKVQFNYKKYESKIPEYVHKAFMSLQSLK